MKCTKCDTEMFHANLTGNGIYSLILTSKKKSIWESDKSCNALCYVCPKCGYIELYAENPQKLKRD